MTDNFVTAGKGLQLMFWGAIAALVGAFIPFLGGIIIIAAGLVSLYGLYIAMPTHENFKMAMYMEIAAVVVSILGAIFSKGILGGIMDIASAVVSFLILYYVCTAAAALLTAKGDRVQADKANLIITLNLVCTVVSVVCVLVGWIPLVNILAWAVAVISGIVAIVATVLQLIFYYKSSKSLLA